MNDSNAEILRQLTGIKRWIAVGSLGFFLAGGGIALFAVTMQTLITLTQSDLAQEGVDTDEASFSSAAASDLFHRNKTDELAALIDERLTTHPNDATALWFSARLHALSGEWESAIQVLERIELLAPNWTNEYTRPLRRTIDRLRA